MYYDIHVTGVNFFLIIAYAENVVLVSQNKGDATPSIKSPSREITSVKSPTRERSTKFKPPVQQHVVQQSTVPKGETLYDFFYF